MNRTEGAAILLGIAALLGAILATRRLKEQSIPLGLSLAHGTCAVVGLGLLLSFVADLVHVAGTGAALGFVPVALGILGAGALGGCGLLSFRLRRKPMPRLLLGLHALAAVVGYVSLLLGIATGK